MIRHPGISRVGLLVATAVSAAFVLLACRPAEQTPARRVVRLTTGTPGAGFYPLGEALARAYSQSQPLLDVQVHDSAGSVANVTALQRGEADVGLSYADVAYMAFVGRLEGRPQAFEELRGIAVLELTPVHLVVRANSGIRDAAGLRGRKIGVGLPGSGSALTADIVLAALGIDASSVHLEPLRYVDAGNRLAAGPIDAMFVTGGDPMASVRASTGAGARLVPLTGPAIERLRHDYPFFRLAVIPGGTYPGHPDPIQTIGVDNLLVCRRNLDESLVHDLTARFFDSLPSLSMLTLMDLDQAPATPIPLHDGAARYYRERELSR
ncbi:MAG: TAXI family TRAP transporter solute-binding subunit [Acidobacteria bacterium]|nr:TAXI family TRAP transporter solute-binding subunit [Acidobacteriota bacterium]